MAFKWSDSEKEILKKHYPAGGFAACRKAGLDRPKHAVKTQAMRLGLKAAKRLRWEPDDFIDAEIKAYYRGPQRAGGVRNLADRVKRPRWWITDRARHLGVLGPRFSAGPWSDAEIELLYCHAHKTDAVIHEKMKAAGFCRSASDIRRQRRQRQIKSADGIYSVPEVADLFGVNRATVNSWLNKGWLKGQRGGDLRSNIAYCVKEADIKGFMVGYTAHIDFARIDKFWLVDVLVGQRTFYAKTG